ncbi:MAG: thiamine pyrophosphate-requiring protein [Acidimicrobiales bacterium]|nr:thiamine pyrophosphate-requiring protein [Acidimicrobiales bacterium]MBO0893078.1 thiamine pyrophosphate-requiring protein [Acidimicrobiales bacterium]
MSTRTIGSETVAESYLSLLRERGVERLYVNAGTDFPSVVESYGRQKDSKLELPEAVVCAHENLAVGMAHGAYLAGGHPQAVMLHVSVGTANAICGIINATRDRIPILLTAGRTPLFEEGAFGSRSGSIHWAQEMFDQAGMLRELVKWDYELRDGLQVEAVVDRAVGMAMSEPRGPIYLTLPREVLARPMDGLTFRDQPLALPAPPSPDEEAVTELADLMARAQFPVIAASAAGRDPQAVKLLSELSRRFGIGVVENLPRTMNLPADHPLHLGYRLGPVLPVADVICFLECDVPWIPNMESPRDETVLVHAGVDPLFSRYPIRSHRANLAIQSSPRRLLEALAAALEERSIDAGRYERVAALAAEHRANQERTVQADADAGGSEITRTYLNWALGEVRPADAIVVNEYWAQAGLLGSTEPGTYFGTPPAGGLGWGLPAALGVQLERPDRTVIATVGDGSYLFANPAACHHAAAMHDLPVLTIVHSNAKWAAVEGAARGMYPQGHAMEEERVPLSRLDPVPAFERYAEASGGFGAVVKERAELLPTLRRALDVVKKEHRQAVVNVLSPA